MPTHSRAPDFSWVTEMFPSTPTVSPALDVTNDSMGRHSHSPLVIDWKAATDAARMSVGSRSDIVSAARSLSEYPSRARQAGFTYANAPS